MTYNVMIPTQKITPQYTVTMAMRLNLPCALCVQLGCHLEFTAWHWWAFVWNPEALYQ